MVYEPCKRVVFSIIWQVIYIYISTDNKFSMPHTTNSVLCIYVRMYICMCACIHAYMDYSMHCLCTWTDINSVAPVLRFTVFLPTLLPPTSNPLYHSYLSFQTANSSKLLFCLAVSKFHFGTQGWKATDSARTLWVNEMISFS